VVLPVDAEDYERRVAMATEPLDVFADQLVAELDDQNGGFGWWVGYNSDWKTLTLLSDYLIQLVDGVGESLLSASLAAKTHGEMVTAENYVQRAAARQGRSPFPLNAQGRRRALTITQSAESCFFHLGQALDRLSVAVIIVGGFEINDAMKLDWGTVEEAAAELPDGSERERYQPKGTPGRTAQEALVAPAANWQPFGPDDWFPWMRDTRNGMTHRAGAKKMMLLTTEQKLARVFYRQPRWSELQSLVYGGRPPRKPFYGTYILSATEDVLDGLCDSTAKLVEAMTAAITTCWSARQANPQMIAQHGRQWRMVEPIEPMWNFPGYGNITPDGRTMGLNPASARRWQVGRVMDDRRNDWY
jgi:hypothetical protein